MSNKDKSGIPFAVLFAIIVFNLAWIGLLAWGLIEIVTWLVSK